jgi:hypothetical protein
MTALSQGSGDGPGALDGLRPEALVKGVHAAIESGLVDDLDWLAAPAAGIALYTLASALPSGPEQRDLGRRVLARMLAADAATFTAIATAMAQAGGKGLATPAMRARVALVTELPLAHAVNDGPLALALISRRDLAREWVGQPSTGSLPARRLAAKLLERAAREAAAHAQMGDMHALRIFGSDTVRGAFNRLLADRESLVWRYVAVTRGLCAAWVPALKQQIEESLVEGLSPTEWRRAATSLAAFGAVKPDEAIDMTLAVVKRGLFTFEDPASASAFVWGISRTIESEPEAASKMLTAVLAATPPEVAEAVAELRFEHGPSEVVAAAEAQALERMRRDKRKRLGEDDGADALFQGIASDLEASRREDPPLRDLIARALDAFATDGARAANAKLREMLGPASGEMAALEAVAHADDAEDRSGELARRTSMAVLRDLDLGFLERNVAGDLAKLGTGAEQVHADEASLDALRERFAAWMVACETSQDKIAAVGGRPKQPTLRLRRLRALLHLVDGEVGDGADAKRSERLRALWFRMVAALVAHFERDPVPILRRTVLAALARALDALTSLGACDVADALLLLGQRITTTKDFTALEEASMDPNLRHALAQYAVFLAALDASQRLAQAEADLDTVRRLPASDCLAALQTLADELARDASPRIETLRKLLVRLRDALGALASASSLHALANPENASADLLEAVETWINALAQTCIASNARFDPAAPPPPSVMERRLLRVAVAKIVAGADKERALAPVIGELTSTLPHGLSRLVSGMLWGLAELPVAAANAPETSVHVADRLPAWLPARRTIGGFYVVRSLGVGGTASVLVVNRVEDRHDPNAERFALKVPDYNATAARSVSQEEFFKLFREEASALIMLPNHANLARFVTFDLAARPLPILVMELVEGMTLERVVESHAFDMKRCLKAFDDVLGGLEAMHAMGVGHLDLKPSNVLLRKGEEAVLVDFGLAGRKIRPGCGTGPYGAPEVWGVVPDGYSPTPPAADIYSFACLAFEMLTSRVLFDAPNEVAQIAMHIQHDGSPPPMKSLAANPDVGPLAEVLSGALRRDPRLRPTAAELRREIRSVAKMVGDASWPVGAPARKATPAKLELVLDSIVPSPPEQ